MNRSVCFHRTLLYATCALLLAALVCAVGCSTMGTRSTSLENLNEMDAALKEQPNPQVDMNQVQEASEYFEEEDNSFSAMTAEKFGKKFRLACLTLVHQEPNEPIAVAAFEEGVELFDQGQFEAAAKKLGYAAFRWPDSALQEDALFLRGEAYFFANRYSKAQRAYEKLLKKYDSTRYMDRVSPRLFAIAQYWEKLDQINHYGPITPNFTDKTRPFVGTFGNAIKAYRTIALHDPNGLWAEHAVMAAGNANYIRGEYFDAADFYDDLIKNYPQSKHLLPACELNLSAKLLMYQGPEYDGKALEDAEDLTNRLLSQFGPQLADRRQALLETQSKITEAKAERDLEVAAFYEAKRCYGAARYYYMLVMQDYPQTQSAIEAKKNYARIEGFRAEPKDYFAWLKVIFPEKN